jgi:hypothetical protein
MKGELGQGSAPRQIEGAANGTQAGTTSADGQAAQAAQPAQPAAPAEQPQAGDGT